MSDLTPQKPFNILAAVKKLFLSAFLIFSFAAYVLHKPSSTAAGNLSQVPPAPKAAQPEASPTAQAATTAATAAASAPTNTSPAAAPTDTPTVPTATAPATAAANAAPASAGRLKDGTYTGPEVDAFYGLVQVQAVVQNGKISNVQFLEYPNDRRTSQRINSFAVPTLQQEAIQAQSANVDIISGATLTSQAFQISLQQALQKAGG